MCPQKARIGRDFRLRGAYPADRAASLAGVPLSTVYYWARERIYVPSISRGKVMLWSWADLLALRAISWLRSTKPDVDVRPTTMRQVRTVLYTVEEDFDDRLGDHLANKSIILQVDSAGRPFVSVGDTLVQPLDAGALQAASQELMIDLLTEYESGEGFRGPHLLNPRPKLRIIPGKLGGEPHIEDTRIETRVVTALVRRGFETNQVLEFYPFLDSASIAEAVDLEAQLDRNLGRVAA